MFEMQATDGSGQSFNARPLHRQLGAIVHGGGDDNDDGDVNDNDTADDGEDDGGVDPHLLLSVGIAPGPEHKSLESPRLHSLDMLQHHILILGQHKNLVVTHHGDPFRKIGRIP